VSAHWFPKIGVCQVSKVMIITLTPINLHSDFRLRVYRIRCFNFLGSAAINCSVYVRMSVYLVLGFFCGFFVAVMFFPLY